MEYHVSIHGNDQGKGTADQPLRTISRTAAHAMAGGSIYGRSQSISLSDEFQKYGSGRGIRS